ncbi:MAG: 2-hydroxyacid dehydrogenase [Thermoleophilaceae bacterium]
MARVFVTRRLPGDALNRLADEHDVEVWQGRLQPSHAKLLEKAGDCEGLLTLLTDKIDRGVIEGCEKLEVISNYAVGVDNVDVEAATERGIPVGYTPDVLTEATADATFALLLAAARRIVEGDAVVRAGRWLTWEPDLLLGQDVHGKTLGIIGMGRIGSAVARRAEGFGMEVVEHSHSSGVSLDELLEQSDFVSIHCRLTEDTRGLIDTPQFKQMKRSAILINTARGAIVDTGALTRALSDGWIAGAALDVADPEPVPKGHPLLDAPNLILNPHIASASIEARTAMADLAVDNLLAGLAGKPMPECFNEEALKASSSS